MHAQIRDGYRARKVNRRDVVAGFTVALVLIPQSLAYAELAGMPPERGLYAAALPLIVAAVFACSPYLQTGPVAITSLMTFGALSGMAEPGTAEWMELALALALVVGAFRLAIGLARAGMIAYLLSQPLLIGFIPAAALLIILSQAPAVVGVEAPAGHLVEQAAWTLAHPARWTVAALAFTAGTLAVITLGRRRNPVFPWVLVALLGAIAISGAADYSGAVVGQITAEAPPLSFDLPWADIPALLLPGAVIAVVGYAETAAIARTFAARDRERWNSNREFVSQGMANVTAAVTGGFPVGGSFSRSSLNRLAGGWSRWSGAVTGAVVLVGALPLAFLLSPLPDAVLAAIVIAAVSPLVRLDRILALWRPSKPATLIAVTTFAATIVSAPHVERGLLLGVGLSVASHLWRETRIDTEVWRSDGALHMRPTGVLWFGVAQGLEDRLVDELARPPELGRLVLHLDGLGRLDITGAIAVRRVLEEARAAGMEAELGSVRERDLRLVNGVIKAQGAPLNV